MQLTYKYSKLSTVSIVDVAYIHKIFTLGRRGLGCHMGNLFTGCFMYADGITLLAPSCQSLNEMLNICKLYELEHEIVFNPGKTRYMQVRNGNLHLGSVNLMNNHLLLAETCSLSGINVLPDFKADINATVQRFNVKCISMLLDFKHLQFDIFSKLIGEYCLVYGSQLWDYESGRAQVFYVAWRKAMRRVWQLSNVTHCSCCPLSVTVYQSILL